MKTANEIAELQYDGGGELPAWKVLARRNMLSHLTRKILDNPNQYGIDLELLGAGDVAAAIVGGQSDPLEANLRFMNRAHKVALDTATYLVERATDDELESYL